MALPSGESLLISSLINVGNIEEAITFGVTPDLFVGYRDEYNWLHNYLKTYGEQPSKEIFQVEFPGFPFTDHEDVRAAVDLVLKADSKNRMREAINTAIDLINMGDMRGAYSELVEAEPRSTSAKPKRLLTDMTFFDTWEDDDRGVEVPYRDLQRHTGGIKKGNLWYLAARPGNGKTAHLCNIATHAVLQGCNVLFYSLEMSEMEVRARFHAALASKFGWSGITMNDIRFRTVDLGRYKEFIQYLDESGRVPGVLDIHTPRDGMVTPATVATRAADYDLNIIDYVTLMRADSGSSAVDDWRTAASISNRLKEVALSEGTGILAASQINRDGEAGQAPPKVKNLAQSDALGQDGDVVVTLRGSQPNIVTSFSLEKNRHGMDGIRFYTTFDPNRGIYRNIDGEEANDLILEAEAAA
jgi:KaiC/GvpD/RAD55 family RecA-like ATPase